MTLREGGGVLCARLPGWGRGGGGEGPQICLTCSSETQEVTQSGQVSDKDGARSVHLPDLQPDLLSSELHGFDFKIHTFMRRPTDRQTGR